MHWIEAHAQAAEFERDIMVRNATREAAIRQELEAGRREGSRPRPPAVVHSPPGARPVTTATRPVTMEGPA